MRFRLHPRRTHGANVNELFVSQVSGGEVPRTGCLLALPAIVPMYDDFTLNFFPPDLSFLNVIAATKVETLSRHRWAGGKIASKKEVDA